MVIKIPAGDLGPGYRLTDSRLRRLGGGAGSTQDKGQRANQGLQMGLQVLSPKYMGAVLARIAPIMANFFAIRQRHFQITPRKCHIVQLSFSFAVPLFAHGKKFSHFNPHCLANRANYVVHAGLAGESRAQRSLNLAG